ncbi:MAG: cupredoxin family copper-binding protein [Chloroflexota bacterium]
MTQQPAQATGGVPAPPNLARAGSMEDPMRRLMIPALVLSAALAAGACSSGSSATANAPASVAPAASSSAAASTAPSAASGAAVDIKGFAFNPATLSAKVGDAVTWTNQDSVPHTVTFDDKSADSGNLAQGATFNHTFDKAGTFAYHCSIHPQMTGTVTVG